MYKESISDRLQEEIREKELQKDLLSFKECEKMYWNIVSIGKQSIDEQFDEKVKMVKGHKKIYRSSLINQHHMKKAILKYKMCEEIFQQVLQSIQNKISDNQQQYCLTLISFIVQGALRMFEPKLTIRCLPEHSGLVTKIISDAQFCFEDIMQAQAGRSFPVQLVLNEKNPLKKRFLQNEFQKKDEQVSCIGGIILTDGSGNITYKNTIDTRVNILREICLPQMRSMLWPTQ